MFWGAAKLVESSPVPVGDESKKKQCDGGYNAKVLQVIPKSQLVRPEDSQSVTNALLHGTVRSIL